MGMLEASTYDDQTKGHENALYLLAKAGDERASIHILRVPACQSRLRDRRGGLQLVTMLGTTKSRDPVERERKRGYPVVAALSGWALGRKGKSESGKQGAGASLGPVPASIRGGKWAARGARSKRHRLRIWSSCQEWGRTVAVLEPAAWKIAPRTEPHSSHVSLPPNLAAEIPSHASSPIIPPTGRLQNIRRPWHPPFIPF